MKAVAVSRVEPGGIHPADPPILNDSTTRSRPTVASGLGQARRGR
jgi:hypothetical protein